MTVMPEQNKYKISKTMCVNNRESERERGESLSSALLNILLFWVFNYAGNADYGGIDNHGVPCENEKLFVL